LADVFDDFGFVFGGQSGEPFGEALSLSSSALDFKSTMVLQGSRRLMAA
jgi:hypothetical protein